MYEWGPLEHIHHASYIARTTQKVEQARSRVYQDPVVTDFCRETGRALPDSTTHGIVRLTKENYYHALKKSDKLEVYDVPHDIEGVARRLFGEHFLHLRGRFGKTDILNVELVPNKAAGFPFGCTKEKAVKSNFSYFQWYCLPGNRERPMPVWSATGKVEYLSMDEIRENKIRIFRNPSVDYLILEKIYYQHMDNYLLKEENLSWSALGFKKEFGNWDQFVEQLRFQNHDPRKQRFFFKWDVGRFDKAIGMRKSKPIMKERKKRFDHILTDEEKFDLKWLAEEAGISYELLPNGQVVVTALCQKSGRYLTSSFNTEMHIYILLTHYVKVCSRLGLKPSSKHCREVLICFIYSDDIQGATDFPEFVQERDLAETFAWFGMEVKEYSLSTSPYSIHFLGAANGRWQDYWVPVYDEKRMLFALAYTEGALTDSERCQRISGLAHNLAFSQSGSAFALSLAKYLQRKGRWVGCPMIDQDHIKLAYTPVGSALEIGPKNCRYALPKRETVNLASYLHKNVKNL